jgi:hypothetical protein
VVHGPDPAAASLRDVIGPVQRATATKPVKPPRSSKPAESTGKEGGDAGTQGREDSNDAPLRADATEPDDSEAATGPTFPETPDEPAPSRPERSARKAERAEETSDPSAHEEAAELANNDSIEKNKKKASGKPATRSDSPEKSEPSSQPVGLMIGLFASLAANVFLLWTAASQRVRYRSLVERGRGDEGRLGHESFSPEPSATARARPLTFDH